MNIKTFEGTFIAPQGRFALVVGRFNSFVVESLLQGAIDALVRHGIKPDDLTIIRVPGAFEIPLAVQKIAQRDEFDAIIALGAVIRGGTPTSNTWPASAPRVWPRSPWNSAYRCPLAS